MNNKEIMEIGCPLGLTRNTVNHERLGTSVMLRALSLIYLKTIIKSFVICLLISSYVYAGDFACFDADNTVANRVVKKISSQGKAYSSRIDCVRISREQFNTITNRHKVDGKNVVAMTQEENDLLDSVIVDIKEAAETLRISTFDNNISIADIGDAELPKIDQTIDNIPTLAEAKTFLKKLVRYLLND